MPTYLCHGFRWHRRAIRIFVILQNLEDATPDWITGRKTSSIILSEFQEIYKFLPEAPEEPVTEPQDVPKINPMATHQDDDFTLPPPRVPPEDDDVLTNSWSVVKLLEEHDPDDLLTVCRPYAYVADYVVKVDLSVNVMDEMNKYETWAKSQEGWFAKLRDELQADEKVQWFIVVCGDEPRDERDESDGEELLRDDESEVTERGVASERTSSQQEEIRPELIERKPTPFDGLDFGFGRRSDSEHMLPSPGPPPPNPPPPVPTEKPRSRAPSQSHPQPQLQSPAQIHPQARSPVKMHTHSFSQSQSQSQSQPQLQSPQRTSSSNKPSLDVTDPEVQVKPSPKLRKRKSLAAGLRRMFGKKEEQQPMPEQI